MVECLAPLVDGTHYEHLLRGPAGRNFAATSRPKFICTVSRLPRRHVRALPQPNDEAMLQFRGGLRSHQCRRVALPRRNGVLLAQGRAARVEAIL